MKWERQHGHVQIGSARVINKRINTEEIKEEKAEEIKKSGSFRRTSAPPKVRTGRMSFKERSSDIESLGSSVFNRDTQRRSKKQTSCE